jgi:nicotinate-nucleotide pyrophosphorylase (carboxylating)
MSQLPDFLVAPIVQVALHEDMARGGDISAALLPPDATFRAVFRARAGGVVAGLQPARIACHLIDPALRFTALLADGDRVAAGGALAEIDGPARSVLSVERTALNFLTLMSGVATLTAQYVAAVGGAKAKIAGTRKTLPGLRALQKEAIRLGGGWPHRLGLDDAVLIKDNHIAAAGGVDAALAQARAVAGHMRVVEIEVDSLAQLAAALPYRPHAVLLDNFSLTDLRQAVAMTSGQTLLEASGGVTLSTVGEIAGTGVDVISVGALTHSAPALDVGLDTAVDD